MFKTRESAVLASGSGSKHGNLDNHSDRIKVTWLYYSILTGEWPRPVEFSP